MSSKNEINISQCNEIKRIKTDCVTYLFKMNDGRLCVNIPVTSCLGWDNSEVCVLHCFPVGLSYSCPLCSWLNNSLFIGCLPLPDSLPHSLAGISLDQFPNKLLALKYLFQG